jgi:hypothetical protein
MGVVAGWTESTVASTVTYPRLVPTSTNHKIVLRHRNLFDISGDTAKSMMSFGFQMDLGWYGLVERLCKRLQPITSDGFVIVSVKSKYATLRISYRGGTDAIDAEVAMAKTEAAVTCDMCGAAGQRQVVDGRWSVRCAACAG